MSFAVSKIGYYLPVAVFGGILNSIGNGLLSTLTPTTQTAKWVGYQIVTGAGRGAAMQIVCLSPPFSFATSLSPLPYVPTTETYNLLFSH